MTTKQYYTTRTQLTRQQTIDKLFEELGEVWSKAMTYTDKCKEDPDLDASDLDEIYKEQGAHAQHISSVIAQLASQSDKRWCSVVNIWNVVALLNGLPDTLSVKRKDQKSWAQILSYSDKTNQK